MSSYPSAYARVADHRFVRRFTRSAGAVKITKYAIGSVVALVTSVIVFAICDWAGQRTGISSALAFIAGAIPNWILNRRWAWKMDGRVEWMREIVAYTIISVLVWAASTWATGHTKTWATHHLTAGSGLRIIVTTGAYVAVQAVFFVVKYVIYDKWVFGGRSRVRAALRSRAQVRSAARANRTP
jgi:putative flippase GtrA